jgi:hypothetical protein
LIKAVDMFVKPLCTVFVQKTPLTCQKDTPPPDFAGGGVCAKIGGGGGFTINIHAAVGGVYVYEEEAAACTLEFYSGTPPHSTHLPAGGVLSGG